MKTNKIIFQIISKCLSENRKFSIAIRLYKEEKIKVEFKIHLLYFDKNIDKFK